MSSPRILLTNDDGIDAPGLTALAEVLDSLGEVLVVAPAAEQSAMGRSLSYGRKEMSYTEDVPLRYEPTDAGYGYEIVGQQRERGYALAGSPSDCAIVGITAFERPDIVVSGCNDDTNLGAGVLTRSGTVSAAIEAAYLGVSSVAVSTDGAPYENAAAVTRLLVEWTLDQGLETANYLNVNVPSGGSPSPRLTRPCPAYEMDAQRTATGFHVTNRLERAHAELDVDQSPPDTDRRAFIECGETSISPLALPTRPVEPEASEALLQAGAVI